MKWNRLSDRRLLLVACVAASAAGGLCAGSAFAQDQGAAVTNSQANDEARPKYEVIPVDSGKKASKDTKLDVVEQSGYPEPAFPNLEAESKERKKLERMSVSAACRKFEGKIVSYLDQVLYVQNCKQRVIEDPELLNELMQKKKMEVTEIPVALYKTMPFGAPYSRADLNGQPKGKSKTISKEECHTFEGKYVTGSAQDFYFIENCKRRPFADLYQLEEHNKKKLPIRPIPPDTLERIPLGAQVVVKGKDESAILYNLDGDVVWSKLFRAGDPEKPTQDSPEQIERINEKRSSPIKKDALCKQFEKRVISFYSRLYFVEGCQRRPLEKFTLELQQHLEDAGGVKDMTPEEYRVLPEGKKIEPEEALKKLR